MSGATGGELWRYEIPAAAPTAVISPALAVALAGGLDVVVAGATQNDPDIRTATALTVVKLAAASGGEVWRRDVVGTQVDGTNAAWAVALDGAGDVLAAGYAENVSTRLDFTVVKLAGSDGTEVWRYVASGTGIDPDPNDLDTSDYDTAYALSVDGAGNAFAAGFVDNSTTRRDLMAVKLAAADGSEIWRREVGSCVGVWDWAASIAINAGGDALLAGSMRQGVGSDAAVLKLDGTDGSEVQDSRGRTRHRVTMSQATYATLAGGRAEPSACIHAAFAFLLDREPKESILARFDVTVIGRYFPEFERKIGGNLR